jgi:cardiolipin synthase A/B
MITASELVPLWNRATEWERRLAMIREARLFLYLSTFYVEYDEYGVALLDALDAAQRRGVAVNLLIDGFGQQLGGVVMSAETRAGLQSRIDELRRAGATVTFYRPRHRLQRWLGGGQHVKIQVSDAGEAIFGSSNITRMSFEAWNEYSVALRGPVVPRLLESYADIGGSVQGAHLDHLRAIPSPAAPAIALEYWICNPNLRQGPCGPLGWRGSNTVTDGLRDMIAAARESIAITSFYFKSIDALVVALVEAAQRGVRIEIFHSHRDALPATELAWIAAAAHYRRLLRAGVAVYENRHGEHSKITAIDGRWVAFGSYNFEHAAHDRLAEAMLVSRDPAAVAPALAIFAELREHPDNVLLTSEHLHRLPARLRLKRTLLGPFKRWM